jgi:hypothetical protein
MISVSRLNGGPALAGKTGRNTANPCETNATETNAIAAAHFISRRLIKLQNHHKKNFARHGRVEAGVRCFESLWDRQPLVRSFNASNLANPRFRLFFPTDPTRPRHGFGVVEVATNIQNFALE